MNSQQPPVPNNNHKNRSSLLLAAVRVLAFALISLPLLVWGNPQAQPQAPGTNSPPGAPGVEVPPAVEHVKLQLDNGNPALEIETTAPVIPEINKSNEGMRLVIDLPNTNMSVADKVVPIKNKDLSEMRLNLVGSTPPRVHVEVDFRVPLSYTWNATGNRLLITFREPGAPTTPAAAAATTTTPLPVSAPVDIADFTNVVAAERLAPGYSVSATDETTVLRVKRVGDVYICPQTTVSVVRSKNGPDLLLGINSGGLETHLSLKNSADEVVTPDFRILLRGPGDFHYAIRSDSRGNACVKTLPGNTASAIIYEVMGDGSYNVQAQDQIFLHDGKLSPEAVAHSQSNNSADSVLAVECGCPPPARAVLVASNRTEPKLAIEDPSPGPAAPAARRLEVTSDPGSTLPNTPAGSSSQAPPETATEIRDLPATLPNQPHVQVEASLTFTPNPARLAASHLPAISNQVSSPVAVLPPSPPPAPEHKTVFGKIKGFFSRVFQ